MVAVLYLMALICVSIASPLTPLNSRYILPQFENIYQTLESIKNEGYPAEAHHVETSDGYILEVHRIPSGKNGDTNPEVKPVVLLMHGITRASNAFVHLGSENSMGFHLADAGFDVWLANARGTKLSRRHTTLDPDNDKEKRNFFDFTWEEIGVYDLTALIDYALEVTGRDKLHYIGHSQGGTSFLVLMSLRPEYADKITSINLLAPAAFWKHSVSGELRQVTELVDPLYNLATSVGFVELYPPSNSPIAAGSEIDYCAGDVSLKEMCYLIGLREFDAIDTEAGAAVKQFAHFGQNIRDNQFRRWDYGTAENLARYGSSEPPAYDLSLIKKHITIHYSPIDYMIKEDDTFTLADALPNVTVRRVPRDDFDHSCYIDRPYAKELVTDYLIETIIEEEKAQSNV